VALGRDREQEKLGATQSEMLAVGAARLPYGWQSPAPSEIPRCGALLGAGVVDESPIYALLANSRLNPIDFYAQEFNFMKLHNTLRATQNLLHLPALRQLIHQFIQIPDLLRQRIFDFLHTIATDHSGDEVCIGV
jgi:hypothetical protein